MPSLLSSIPSLKLTQLKHLAVQCGVNSTGTKAVLGARLLEELHQPDANKTVSQDNSHNGSNNIPSIRDGQQRILSIDMGIRNLAYCVLDIPSTTTTSLSSRKKEKGTKIHVHSWKRMAITSPTPTMFSASDSSSTILSSSKEQSNITERESQLEKEKEPQERVGIKERERPKALELELEARSISRKLRRGGKEDKTKEKESFEPPIYAAHAYTFLSTVLARYQPTQILIERQRYRSMGSSAILEWTVRVNMFEGMLYAVLRTMMERGDWVGGVKGVLPAKVTAYWLDQDNLNNSLSGDDLGLDGLANGEDGKSAGIEIIEDPAGGKPKAEKDSKKGENVAWNEEGNGHKKRKKGDNKTAKIQLVSHWLLHQKIVDFNTPESQRTAEAFLARAQGKKNRAGPAKKKPKRKPRKGTVGELVERVLSAEGAMKNNADEKEVDESEVEPEKITKLDDLADCLLQGVAFVKWEENKRVLLPLLGREC